MLCRGYSLLRSERGYAPPCGARFYASRIFAPSASLRSVALRNSAAALVRGKGVRAAYLRVKRPFGVTLRNSATALVRHKGRSWRIQRIRQQILISAGWKRKRRPRRKSQASPGSPPASTLAVRLRAPAARGLPPGITVATEAGVSPMAPIHIKRMGLLVIGRLVAS